MTTYARYIICLVIVWIAFLATIMHHTHLVPDAYYYWVWSRHLASSYYDGPPMIAYALRLITTLFGNSENSILLLGWTTLGLTSFLLYLSAKILFHNERIAFLSVILWGFSTGVIRHVALGITYDTVFLLFWACAFYSFLKLTETRKILYYYLTGMSIGCMLLSKYTGVLLCISLLLYALWNTQCRFIFKSKHAYLSLVLALLIFSPVLYWNMQHHWVSFTYQLNHGFNSNTSKISGLLHYLFNTLLDFNLLFLFLLVIIVKHFRPILKSPPLIFITIPTVLVWLFFLISAFKSMPGSGWNTPSFFTGSLLAAYYFSKHRFKIGTLLLMAGLFLAPTVAYLLATRAAMTTKMATIFSHVPTQLYQGKTLYSTEDYWLPSFATYFLPNHPEIYGTNLDTKQYYFWYQAAEPSKTGDTIVVIAYHASISDPHFSNCRVMYQDTTQPSFNVYFLSCIYRIIPQ